MASPQPRSLEALEAVIYGRQSQGNDRSISEQLAIGHERADTEGWHVDGVFSDEVSASRHGHKAREGWPKLIERLESGQVHVLWLWEASRGDRRASTWALMLEICQDYNVKIYIETHERLYDPNRARDFKSLMEDGVAAAHESDQTSERVRRETRTMARAGRAHGRIAYGYMRIYEDGYRKGHKVKVFLKQVPDPEEAQHVRFIIDAVAAGWSLRSIAADLNRRGIRTRPVPPSKTRPEGSPNGNEWTVNTVRQIALNPIYIGKRVHDTTRRPGGRPTAAAVYYKADWDPLVDEETFYTARDILLNEKRRTWRAGGAKHLLSMIAQCGVCQGPLTAAYPKARDRRPVYACRDKRCVHIDHDDLDEYVLAALVAYLAEDENQRALTAAAQADDGEELTRARGALAEAEAEYKATVALFKAGKISAFAFAEAEPAKIAARDAARERLRELEVPPELRAIMRDPKLSLAEQVADAPLAAQRNLIRYMMRVEVGRAPASDKFVTQGCRIPAEDRTEIAWLAGVEAVGED